MKISKWIGCFAFLTILSNQALATKIVSAKTTITQASPNAEFPIQLEFALEGTETSPWCGLQIDFGNGASRSVRVGDNGANDTKMEIRHAYPNPGQYQIQISGRSLVRGLKTAVACSGGPIAIPITVIDPVAIQMQRQLEQNRRELEEKERALKQAQEQRERDQKAAEEQRKASEAQLREATERQRAAEDEKRRLELEARIKQLEAENRKNAAAAAESRRAAQQQTPPAPVAAPAPQAPAASGAPPPPPAVTRPKAESIL